MPCPEVGGHGALYAVMFLTNVAGPSGEFCHACSIWGNRDLYHLLWSCEDSLIPIPQWQGKQELTLTHPWEFLFCHHLTVNWSQAVSFSEAVFVSLSDENVYLCSCLLSFPVFEQEGVLVAGHPGMQQCLSSCMKPISDVVQWKKTKFGCAWSVLQGL